MSRKRFYNTINKMLITNVHLYNNLKLSNKYSLFTKRILCWIRSVLFLVLIIMSDILLMMLERIEIRKRN